MVRARKPADATNPSSPQNPLKSVPTGRGYGEAQALQDQMAAVTMPAAASPTPAAPPPGPAQPGAVLDVASQFTPPRVGLGDPTARPGEPVTEGLGMPMEAPETLPDPDLEALRAYLPALEKLANLPTSTVATRNLIRRLRGAV